MDGNLVKLLEDFGVCGGQNGKYNKLTPSAVSYLFQSSPELADCLKYLTVDYGLTPEFNLLSSDQDVELFTKYQNSSNYHQRDEEEECRVTEVEVWLLEQELESLQRLEDKLLQISQIKEKEDQRIVEMKRKHSELMAYLKQETCSIEAIIVSLSAQIDVALMETVKQLSIDQWETGWVSDFKSKVELKLKDMQQLYESAQPSDLDDQLAEAELLSDRFYQWLLENVELKCERARIDKQFELFQQHQPEEDLSAKLLQLDLSVNDDHDSGGGDEYSSVYKNILIPAAKDLSIKSFSNIICAEITELYTCDLDKVISFIKQMKQVADEINTCLGKVKDRIGKWSTHSRNVYLTTKGLESVMKQLDLSSSIIAMSESNEPSKVIQRSDRLLWALKELVGIDSVLCSLDALKSAITDQISSPSSSSSKSSKKLKDCALDVVEVEKNLISVWDNDLHMGPAKTHSQILCSDPDLLSDQQALKSAVSRIKKSFS